MSSLSNESFDIQRHLRARQEDPSFSLAEFGHDIYPIAYSQGFRFVGRRFYVGFEGWLYDPEGARQRYLDERNAIQGDGQNIHFIRQELGRYGFIDGFPADEVYEGDYDPVTCLDEASISEVVAINVLTDPLVADDPGRSLGLLSEMRRIVRPDGLVVLRETITPHYRDCIEEGVVARAGLELVARLTSAGVDPGKWQALERVYEDNLLPVTEPAEGSYYAILQHRR